LDDAKQLIHIFIFFQLLNFYFLSTDYCNAMYTGLRKSSLAKLQLIHNASARVLLKLKHSMYEKWYANKCLLLLLLFMKGIGSSPSSVGFFI